MNQIALDLLQKDKPRLIEFYKAEREKIVIKFQNEVSPIDAILKELGAADHDVSLSEISLFTTKPGGQTIPSDAYNKDGYWWERAEFILNAKGRVLSMADIYKQIRAMDGNPVQEGEDNHNEYAHVYGEIAAKAKKNKTFCREKNKKMKMFVYGLAEWVGVDGKIKPEYIK